jgi:ribonuclease J
VSKGVSITVYGGANQIGGNKILLEDGDTKVFLDFGEPFHLKDKFFVDWLMPRESRTGLKDYFEFDLMPRIKGLYGEEWLEGTDLPYQKPELDAILISHMHFDHAMHLKFVDGKIPVFLGAAADCIRCCWEATGGNSVDFGDHDFRTFRTGDRLKIGSLEFEPIHVDHSVPGAYGYVVHTSEGCVAYTGDMRLHGPRSDMTKEFVARAAKEKPLALLCEGTRVSDSDPREDLSEKDVEQRAQRLVSSHGQLSVVSFYPKDVDRMRSFRNVAKETGRKFVVSTKVAHLLQALARDSHIDVPDPMTDPSMMVYVRSGMTRPLPYEKPFLDKLGSGHVIDSDYVARHQRQLIFHTDFMQLTELIDVQPEQGSLFIRSKSEPFEEGDVQEEVLKNWIDWFKLDFHQVHASGHASMSEVFSAVKQIAPGLLIPVHTEHPELFSRCGRSLKCPVAGERISLPQ